MRSVRVATGLAALLAALLALAGCDGGCPGVARCDVLERGCQQQVMKAVACLRGGGTGELPKVRVISEEEFIAIIEAYLAEEPEAQAETEAEYRLWNRGLALFGLAPAEYAVADAIADSAAQTAAAYLYDTGEVVIIDRGRPRDPDVAVEVFAHEIVHALQDQELDLEAYQDEFGVDFDSSLALDAIIEGEAVHYQILAALQLAGRSADDVDWARLYAEWQAEALLDAEADIAPVALADARFPYAFGGDFVTRRWLARGSAGIDALFEDPPRTTSEVMFGSIQQVLAAEQALLQEHAVPALPESFAQSDETALGAWIARLYAGRKGLGPSLRLDLARSLGADRFSIHHDAQSDLLVAAWRTRFLDSSLLEAWPALGEGPFVAGTVERESFVIAADPELPAGAEALAWRAPIAEEPPDPAASALASPWRLSVTFCPLRTPSGDPPPSSSR